MSASDYINHSRCSPKGALWECQQPLKKSFETANWIADNATI